VTTDACRAFLTTGAEPEGMSAEVSRHLSELEESAGRRPGRPDDPLLVSVLFFPAVGLGYVSCSPFPVPVARLVRGGRPWP
jgi:hypothetical protein